MFFAFIDPIDDFLRPALSVISIGAIAIVMLMIAVRVMEKALPFSVRHELEEDHNTAAAIVMGSIILGVAMVIAAVARG